MAVVCMAVVCLVARPAPQSPESLREAEQSARRELAELEQHGQGETEAAALVLQRLSAALRVGSNPKNPETAEAAERAVRITEKLFGPNDRRVADAISLLSSACSVRGDFAQGIAASEREVAIRERYPPDSDLAVALDQLAALLYQTGDLKRARPLLPRALAILRRLPGDHRATMAQILNDLGIVLWGMGDSRAAKPQLQRALAIREATLTPDDSMLAASLNNLAMVEAKLGELQQARHHYERAMVIREKTLGPDHPRVATGLNNLGGLLAEMGDYQAALKAHQRALEIRERSLGPQHPLVALSLANLAQVLYLTGQRKEALETALKAESTSREHLRATIRILPERGALLYSSSRANGLDTVLSFTATPMTAAETRAAWDCLIRSRALVMDEMAARHKSDLSGVAAARERLAHLVVEGPGKLPVSTYTQRLEKARHDDEIAERELATASQEFRENLDSTRAGFEEVARSLPADTALVALARYEQEFTGGHNSSWPAYAAFILPGAGKDPAAVWLGKARTIEALVAQWRGEMAKEAAAPGMAPALRERGARQAGLALRRAVWDPMAARLGGARRVLLVADGALALVKFGALPGEGTHYLAEDGPVIEYLVSERDLVGQRPAPSGSGLLALGDPDFGEQAPPADATCRQFSNLHLLPLPGALAEIERLATLWKAGSHAFPNGPVELLHGAAATEEAFEKDAPGKRVIHLATHAVFLKDACGTAVADENPLLRSGVALAGPGGHFLTAEEIAAMPLEGVEWAVLSGCDTGLGQVTSGESVLGLPRAFQVAGARTVVMSLWPVEDQTASEWMTELYRLHFVRRLPTADAVRGADLHVLNQRRARHQSTHPFYWGGFLALRGRE
jgi:tetratricopeptide (TPR) repeat protein